MTVSLAARGPFHFQTFLFAVDANSKAGAEDTDEADIDPEQYLPDAKRRRLQKRRGGRRLAEPPVTPQYLSNFSEHCPVFSPVVGCPTIIPASR